MTKQSSRWLNSSPKVRLCKPLGKATLSMLWLKPLPKERISSRRPLAYLVNRAWFAGHEFYIDERAIVPRSHIGEWLPDHLEPLDHGWIDYARRAGDDLALYSDSWFVHPCGWSSLANNVMIRHLVDGPWIHTRSRIVHHSAAMVGATALVEAKVVDRFETRRGNRAVIDVDISVDGGPVATVRHEALVSLTPTDL